MKPNRLIASLAFLFCLSTAQGQYITRKPTTGKDSVVDGVTKYVTWPSTIDGIQSFVFRGIKSTGTPSAYVLLQGRVDSTDNDWVDLKFTGIQGTGDTLKIGNNANHQIQTWPLDKQYFNGYRFKIVSTGTQKFYIYPSYLRRSH